MESGKWYKTAENELTGCELFLCYNENKAVVLRHGQKVAEYSEVTIGQAEALLNEVEQKN